MGRTRNSRVARGRSRASGPTDVYIAPYHLDVIPWSSWENYGTSLPTRVANTSYLTLGLEFPTGGGSFVSGDWIEWYVNLAAGTYTFTVIAITNTTYGIAEYTLDGSTIATFDWYASGATLNVAKQATGVVVPTSGVHTLRATCTGKNASSAGYTILANAINFMRTGA